MTINVKATIESHVNQAFVEGGDITSLDFLKKLIDSEYEHLRSAAERVLNREFKTAKHQNAYRLILENLLATYTLTDTIALFDKINLDIDDEQILDHNLLTMAERIDLMQNTWSWLKGGKTLTKCVRDCLTAGKGSIVVDDTITDSTQLPVTAR